MRLFSTDGIVDGECKTIRIADGVFTKEIFAVFKDNEFYVYQNNCPHTGAPLDWMPNQFLNLDKSHIQCSTHHALFRIKDGFCVAGPCTGQSLKKVPVKVQQGYVIAEIEGNGSTSA
jgi:nitrite reductase/ring-hydroxylating ferredoxin subunit